MWKSLALMKTGLPMGDTCHKSGPQAMGTERDTQAMGTENPTLKTDVGPHAHPVMMTGHLALTKVGLQAWLTPGPQALTEMETPDVMGRLTFHQTQMDSGLQAEIFCHHQALVKSGPQTLAKTDPKVQVESTHVVMKMLSTPGP